MAITQMVNKCVCEWLLCWRSCDAHTNTSHRHLRAWYSISTLHFSNIFKQNEFFVCLCAVYVSEPETIVYPIKWLKCNAFALTSIVQTYPIIINTLFCFCQGDRHIPPWCWCCFTCELVNDLCAMAGDLWTGQVMQTIFIPQISNKWTNKQTNK